MNEHGADILLGGHDHLYFVSKGTDKWDGHDKSREILGAENDKGDVLVIKSGCDFRNLSEFTLELEDTPEGSFRRKVIKRVTGTRTVVSGFRLPLTYCAPTGKRHNIQPGMRSSAEVAEILKNVLSSVSSALKASVCRATVELDLRSRYIRVDEVSHLEAIYPTTISTQEVCRCKLVCRYHQTCL